jgi:2,4-dienoyl-CoA reductase (NADPH2)
VGRIRGADYLNVTLGQRGGYVKDISHPEGVAVDAAAAVKAITTLPVVVAGRIVDPAHAEAILERGAADLIGMARGLVADPAWPRKAAAGAARSIRPCIGVNQECRTFPGGILCAANARAGRERWFAAALAAPRRAGMRIGVVGGGPAGLEAARFAAELGGEVVLWERAPRLGGQLRLAAAVRSRAGLLALTDHLEHEARRLGVEVRLGEEPDGLDDFDAVIAATGAAAVAPPFGVSVWDVLAGARPAGERAVVVDDGSGSWDAVSAAESLADAGCRVALVTPARSVGAAIPFESVAPLLRRLGERAVALHELTRVTGFADGVARLESALTGEPRELAADFVAVHAGAESNEAALAGAVVRAIGDCVAPRGLTQAIWEADRAVLELLKAGVELRPTARAW